MLLTLSLALISMAVIGYLIRILIVDKLQIEKVEDRVVLITGSAGGFGRKIVTKCLENKMTVFATCRTKEVSPIDFDAVVEWRKFECSK
ncbi:unnamed protein product [Anisakis simplex]|uniref:KR domain-containing protein n=1 Tax=Anisakis simplex TaxID=6269 RepID=A0A0M3JL88_ANISI|nr:unnamed protein product [Anisakis simplex]